MPLNSKYPYYLYFTYETSSLSLMQKGNDSNDEPINAKRLFICEI